MCLYTEIGGFFSVSENMIHQACQGDSIAQERHDCIPSGLSIPCRASNPGNVIWERD